jgi:pseudaminic acid cytidylyltransferase
MNICVIQARGGSRRIPKKNIKIFHGKPMIAWSIEAAKKSKCFDKIIVSTDDNEIANIAIQYGAEVPFLRPTELSDDYASTPDVMQHAAIWLSKRYKDIDKICCIFGTAPLVNYISIREGLKKINEKNINYVISLARYSSPIQRAMYIDDLNIVKMLQPENLSKRSQELQYTYFDAAQFYWGKVNSWLKKDLIFSNKTKAIVIDEARVQDIDTLDDWNIAELKANYILKLSSKNI